MDSWLGGTNIVLMVAGVMDKKQVVIVSRNYHYFAETALYYNQPP
ncbi:MAG: hypothetical protein AAHH96_07160 [Candidatus Symbiodolus clandestinus]